MGCARPVRAASASSTALSRPAEKSTPAVCVAAKCSATIASDPMYLATKRIDFCYGHRLLDYEGVCKHPHGHNALAEIEVRTDRLDSRNMVADFSDIKRVVKGWIDAK